jgi:hypothetical protein
MALNIHHVKNKIQSGHPIFNYHDGRGEVLKAGAWKQHGGMKRKIEQRG